METRAHDSSLERELRHRRTLAIALVLLVAVVFLETARFEFILLDDPGYIIDNPHVSTGLSLENIQWAWTSFWMSNWHPVTFMPYMIEAELFGLKPGFFHFTNVLFHALNAALLFLLLHRITGSLWSSAFVAAVFAVHPLRVESVAWVSERKDVLSAFFAFSTLHAYVSWVRSNNWRAYGATTILFFLAVASKSMVVTLPCVMLLLDYWPLRRLDVSSGWSAFARSAGKRVAEKAPLFLISAVGAVLAVSAASDGFGMRDLSNYSLSDRLTNALLGPMVYVWKTFWPVGLAPYYPHSETVPFGQVLLSAAFLVAITGFAVASRRHSPYLIVGWLWYLIMIAPVSGLLQQGDQAMADRYAYLPQIGLLLCVAWGIPNALPVAWRRRSLPMAAALVVVVLAALCWRQTRYWENGVTLFTHALAVTPDNGYTRQLLGNELLYRGRAAEAERHLVRALEFNPEHPDRNYKLGQALALQEKMEKAADYYERAIELDPTHAYARVQLGRYLLDSGRPAAAAEQFGEAARLMPGLASAYVNWAVALMELGQYEDAEQRYQYALQLRPDLALIHYNYGLMLLEAGREADAAVQFQKTLEIEPDHAAARTLLQRAQQTEPARLGEPR